MAHGSASSRHIVFYGILRAHEEGWQARDLIFGTVARIACTNPPDSMWSSRYRNSAFIVFVYCTALVNISTASPYTRPHDRWRTINSGASETSVIQTYKEFDTANLPSSAFHNFRALSIRTPHPPQNHNVTFHSLAVSLIPSKAHATLLSQMHAQFYTAASNTLSTLAPVARVAFTLGAFTLTIQVFGGDFVADYLLQILGDVWMAVEPVSWSLVGFFGGGVLLLGAVDV